MPSNQQSTKINREEYCPKCGHLEASDELFCPNCGLPIIKFFKNDPNKLQNIKMLSLLAFSLVILILIIAILCTPKTHIIGQWEINEEISQIYDAGINPTHIKFNIDGTFDSDIGSGNYYIKNNRIYMYSTFFSVDFLYYTKNGKLYIYYEGGYLIPSHYIEYVRIK